jgi:hypothetical protein
MRADRTFLTGSRRAGNSRIVRQVLARVDQPSHFLMHAWPLADFARKLVLQALLQKR